MNVLEMTNIKQTYNGVTVLDIDNFSLDAGEKVALVGPNGSGKTTLMNIAALLNPPAAGVVKISGKQVDFRHPDEHRANVTLVAQEPFFFAGSLLRNMTFGMKFQGMNREELNERINKSLDLVRISHLAKRSPRTFSSGEIKRAAIVRALVLEKPVLLFDEPFANVDSQSRAILESLIRKLPSGQGFVFSTHDLSKAYNLADRIVTLQDGKISPWTPENLYRVVAKRIDDGSELRLESGFSIYYPDELQDDQKYTISIDTNQILISRDKLESSAQNSFKGIIRRIESVGKNLVAFTVDCGNDYIVKAAVTERTVRSFNSTVGDEVWVHFKSAAIHVFQ